MLLLYRLLVYLRVIYLKHSPQITDEHPQTSCGILGSSRLLPHVLFCLQLGIGLVDKQRQTVRMKQGVCTKTRLLVFNTCFGLSGTAKGFLKSIKVEKHVNNISYPKAVLSHDTGFIGLLTF